MRSFHRPCRHVLQGADFCFTGVLYISIPCCSHDDPRMYYFVFLVSLGGCVSLPCSAMGLSAVCDCGIS